MENGSTKAKTFVFHCVSAHGHINSLRGIADTLRGRGHKIIFVCENAFEDIGHTLIGIEERMREEIERGTLKLDSSVKLDQRQHKDVNANGLNRSEEECSAKFNEMSLGQKNAIQQLCSIREILLEADRKNMGQPLDEALKLILDEIKPDVIVSDIAGIVPAVMSPRSPYKWVLNYSCNPLQLYRDYFGDKFPASCLGVSTRASRAEIEQSWSDYDDALWKYFELVNEQKAAAIGLELRIKNMFNPSPYMNIYMFPKCLDYDDEAGGPLPDNWFRSDSSIRQVDGTFEIPQQLANKSGKLVFVSMGTFASGNIDLMRKIVRVLSRSPHRFIVAKGARHAEYELADNMWGEKFVKQTLILPKIDGIITHGGNNTITEALHFGVPSIVVTPMFFDQLDNATRIQDKGLGYSLDIVSASDEEILETLERSLNDEEAKKRVKEASREIKAAKGTHKVATLLEMLADGRDLQAGA